MSKTQCFNESLENGFKRAVSSKSECTGAVHDYDNAIRKGRAWYVCPKCGKDISLEYVMYMDAVQRVEIMGGTVTPNAQVEFQEGSAAE